MDSASLIAVTGTCAPERRRYARRLAGAVDAMLVPAERLAASREPVAEAAGLVPWSRSPGGSVVEFPASVLSMDIAEGFARERRVALAGIVCVADAMHLLDDLMRSDSIPIPHWHGRPRIPRAEATLTHIEHASRVVLVNWEGLSTPNIATAMALVNHLNPGARIRLAQDGPEPAPFERGSGRVQGRTGWAAVLSGEFDPYMTDRRVTGFRYEHLRPLHPDRLHRTLERALGGGEFGTIVRSAGCCRLATRPGLAAVWRHVGTVVELAPQSAEATRGTTAGTPAIGQELAFIGIDIDRAALVSALDAAALDDTEFAAGPAAWRRLHDPFPAWATAADPSD